MKLKKLLPKDMLVESSGVHNYGCAMMYFDFPALSDVIKDKDIYIYRLI